MKLDSATSVSELKLQKFSKLKQADLTGYTGRKVIYMNTKMITVTQEIEVPDCANFLESSLYLIDETKSTNALIEKKIEELAESRITLIGRYCESILSDILKFNDAQVRILFPNGGYCNKGIRTPDGNSYHVVFGTTHDYTTPGRLALSLSLGDANDTFVKIKVFNNQELVIEKEPWVSKSLEFFKGWETYKNIINMIIKELVDKALEKEKQKEKEGTELLNILDNFKI